MDSSSIVAAGQRRISLEQAFQLALDHQQAGRLAQAEQLASKIIEQNQNHAGAWQLLAIIAHRVGKNSQAIELISRAIKLRPIDAVSYANRGEMHRLIGNLDHAIADGQQALKISPDLAQAHSNLGIAWYDKGDLAQAEACQKAALARQPRFAQALNNLGSICRDRKQREQAVSYYQQALQVQPDYREAANNMGAVLTELDRPEEALKLLSGVVGHHPDYAEAHSNIGSAFMALENFDKASLAYSNALKLKGDHAEALEGLARCHLEGRRFDQARALVERALAVSPNRAQAHTLMGTLLSDSGFPELALASFERALAIKPDQAGAWMGKGHVLLEQGDADGAATCFAKAQSLEPESASATMALIQAKKVRAGDENLQRLEQEASKLEQMTPVRATSLHFALGKSYEDTRDYDRAFEHFIKGCALKRQRVSYSADNQDLVAANIRRTFTPELVNRLSGTGDPSQVPIFVLGMPRSGTTLTETIIASHPDVFGAGELSDLLFLAGQAGNGEKKGYPLNCEQLSGDELNRLGGEYVTRLKARAPNARHITDKMPANYLATGLIHLMLPNARIVHVRRNPVDTCVSAFTKLFSRSQYQTYDMVELGRYYRNYLDIMAHWRAVLPDGSFYEVQYENLVSNQDEETRKLIDYCGLSWDDACLSPHKTERNVKTASITQVREPVYTTSVERWRRYEKFLGPLLEALGDAVPR